MTKPFLNPNKTMTKADFNIPAFRQAADAVQETQRLLRDRGLVYSHWCGQLDDQHIPTTIANKGPDYVPLPWAFDDERIPWFTLWEYAWALSTSGALRGVPKKRVLSLGGSSSSCEATVARMGHHVTAIDGRPHTIENARRNAEVFGWDMVLHHGRIEDLLQLVGDQPPFHFMMSTNVLFLCGEPAREAVAKDLHEVIRPGGGAYITFDFQNPNPKRYLDDPKGYFNYRGFRVHPPESTFQDNGERHHLFYPEPAKGRYTAGAVTLRKPG